MMCETRAQGADWRSGRHIITRRPDAAPCYFAMCSVDFSFSLQMNSIIS
jgi:hypothetical protein